MKKFLKILIIVLSVIIVLLIIAISTLAILNNMGKKAFHKNDTNIVNKNVTTEEGGIVYKGERYKLNPDVIALLLIGVDKDNVNEDISVGVNGQADTLLVAVIDTKSRAVTVIPISRETLVDVNQYTTNGNYSGVSNKQICLAYAYGDSVEQSSENVLLSVSRVLFGINISSYVTMDLNALEKLSNAVGSMEVAVNEDYYDTDTGIRYKAGSTIKVKGKSAVNYVHWRTDDVDANNYRMERQQSFMTAFMNKAGNQISDNFSKVITYYNLMKPYVSTNITLSQTTYLTTSCLRINLGNAIKFVRIPGETFLKDGYSAFKPDYDALTDIVIDAFYTKIS